VKTRALYWQWASIWHGYAPKTVFWRQSFTFVPEPPMHRVFWRNFHYCAQIWRKKKISPLNSVNLCMSDMMDEMNFCNPKIILGLGFTIWGCWYMVGWDPQKAQFWSVQFPSAPLVCRKTFPVGCVQDSGNSIVFDSVSTHIRNFWNLSWQQSPLPTYLRSVEYN